MNYRSEMNKALKAYFKSLGFKYVPQEGGGNYEKYYNDDILYTILITDEKRYMPRCFWLDILLFVDSVKFNKVIEELTEGLLKEWSVLVFITVPSRKEPHVEFVEERPMEENVRLFQEHMENIAFPILEKFTDTRQIITSVLHDDFVIKRNRKEDMFTRPIALYLEGESQKAIEYMDKCMAELEHCLSLNPGNTLVIDEIKQYQPFQKNLTQWMKEGRILDL
ncbi:MAG: hypothetical protein J5663_07945 [Bacteroidaceae bacterium]|nr:hypothetical protein [Bacteroidaceae bacterium]